MCRVIAAAVRLVIITTRWNVIMAQVRYTHTSSAKNFEIDFCFHSSDKGADRHLGDLGNVLADQRGIARVHIESDTLTLKGANSIVNRTLAVSKA